MVRPTVLVVDSQEHRRKEIVHGLAGFGYELIAAADADEGRRFAGGLDPDVIVVEAALVDALGDAPVAAVTDGAAKPPFTVVLVDDVAATREPEEPTSLLRVAGRDSDALLRKLRTLLVGRELGLEVDALLESLDGDLQAQPLFELLPSLQRAVVTGRLMIGRGEIALKDGEVIGARLEKVSGVKAFCRIARVEGATFRVVLEAPSAPREVTQDLLSLMASAMEDQHRFTETRASLPDLAGSLRLIMGPAFFATQFSPSQQTVLAKAQEHRSVWSILDAVDAPDGAVLQEVSELKRLGFVEFDEAEIKVRIVTDSTCDLPSEVALRNRIHVVPISVLFGETIHRGEEELTPGVFHKLLQGNKAVHPRTSPPTRGDFLSIYRLMAGRSDVVSLHLSEKLSQTVANARAAAADGAEEFAMLRKDGVPKIEVVDSGEAGVGLALMALLAARMAHRGLTADAIRVRIEEMKPRFHLLFLVDTLEYLTRGGRIGKARAGIGGFLGYKPILGLVDGEVAAVDRVRGAKAAVPRLVELLKQCVDAERPVLAGVAHASSAAAANRVRALIEQDLKVAEFFEVEIGPAVATHVGPGCVGAIVFQPTEAEAPMLAPLPLED